jgi:hypothetical protein
MAVFLPVPIVAVAQNNPAAALDLDQEDAGASWGCLTMKTSESAILLCLLFMALSLAAQTQVGIRGTKFTLNGEVTYSRERTCQG